MHIVKAVSFKVASTLMFAIMGAQVRYLAGAYPEGQVAFFRSLFALIPILIVFGWRGQLKGALRTERPEGTSAARRLQRGRDLCDLRSAGADSDRGFHRHCVRIAADHRDLRRRFLKEKVHAYRWSAVAFGFCGVILMLMPYFRDHAALTASMIVGILFALTNAFTAGGASIQIRRLTATETTSSIVIFMTLLVLLVSLLTAPFGWRMPSTWQDVAILGGSASPAASGRSFHRQLSLRAGIVPCAVRLHRDAVGLHARLLVLRRGADALCRVWRDHRRQRGIFVILRERYLGLKRLRDTPVAAIATMADDEENPDAPVAEEAKAA
jgi:hypothetical protein